MSEYFFKYLHIIDKYFVDGFGDLLYKKWTESWRFWHNINHIGFILKKLGGYENQLDTRQFEILIITAYLHDAIYFPDRKDNESKSIELFKHNIKSNFPQDYYVYICGLISFTGHNKQPSDILAQLFWKLDNYIFYYGTTVQLIDYELKILKEYQFANYNKYRKARIEFLESRLGVPVFMDRVDFLIDYVKNNKPRIGIYAGSFNPMHIGHYNIIEKAEKLFDKVIIAYGNNPDKEERKINKPESMRFRELDNYDGLITDYLDKVENQGVDVTLIRGLRNGYDLNYESTQAQFIQDIRPNTKIVYLSCDKKYEHISSSSIRSLMKFDKDKANKYIVK